MVHSQHGSAWPVPGLGMQGVATPIHLGELLAAKVLEVRNCVDMGIPRNASVSHCQGMGISKGYLGLEKQKEIEIGDLTLSKSDSSSKPVK